MYLLGYSIDNLSLMALTIATGFVVDDAIVVIENITRHLEKGANRRSRRPAPGASEIGFTVLSISFSLVAVFIPILLMGGIVGRLFREFAVTLSVAILVSMVISLTTTPMMCALLLKPPREEKHGRLYRASERAFDAILALYRRTLAVLRHQPLTLVVDPRDDGGDRLPLRQDPEGLLSAAGHRTADGPILADQDTSFQAMNQRAPDVRGHRHAGPGRRATCRRTREAAASRTPARMFVTLKPPASAS